MNERISELMKEAMVKTADMSRRGRKELDPEKFAELIVRECSKVIRNGGYWSGGPLGPKRQATPPEIATMIEEHFGVE